MARRKYSAEFKTKIVIELLREEKQLGEIASEHNISPNQLRNWKKEFLENADKIFNTSKQEKILREREKALANERDELYKTIGQVTFERDWLKKKSKEVFGDDFEAEYDKKP